MRESILNLVFRARSGAAYGSTHDVLLITMALNKNYLTPKYQVCVDARDKFRLSHAHIQMARELGLNPKKLRSLANHDQERWKTPMPQFIKELYLERFGRDRPEVVRTIEELAQKKQQRQSSTQESATIEPVNEIERDPF